MQKSLNFHMQLYMYYGCGSIYEVLQEIHTLTCSQFGGTYVYSQGSVVQADCTGDSATMHGGLQQQLHNKPPPACTLSAALHPLWALNITNCLLLLCWHRDQLPKHYYLAYTCPHSAMYLPCLKHAY